MFAQVIAGLFDRDLFNWQDEYFLEVFLGFCDYVRIIPAISRSQSPTYYWILFCFGQGYILTIVILLFYMNYALKNPKFYFEMAIQLLRILLLLVNWVFFLPFFESFISIFNCNSDGNHYLVTELSCFSSIHAIAALFAISGLVMLIGINVIIALLYNETQTVKEDSLSRLESNFEINMLLYRILIGTLAQFCYSDFCSWIFIVVSLISSLYLNYQFFKYLPYYNTFVSIFFGLMVTIFSWISINAIPMQIFNINGHLVIIIVGIPILYFLVKGLREQRIETLMTSTTEKMLTDIDSLNQIQTIQEWLHESGKTSEIDNEMKVKGFINLHIYECQKENCMCKHEDDLYDCTTDRYIEASSEPHKDQIFVNHFIRQLYEEAINKFISSTSLHISFAFYQFAVLKNIHAAVHQLKVASKKRPTIQQQFTIYRYKNIIEAYIKKESDKTKHIYEQLTNVKEFERLFSEMQKCIEKVCNFQVELWTHLTTVVPDLNLLNELSLKIYNQALEADQYWKDLCKINDNFPQALTLYGEYLTFIRNHPQAGKEYFDQAHNLNFVSKQADEIAKRSEIIFTEDAVVVHISGNKESSGRILKTSTGLYKCFGVNKSEVVGHSINTLMPNLFAEKHPEFLESFYNTGRQQIFNKERQLFAVQRQGYCFTMKLLIKQMPTLIDGIQYVGMIKPITTDYDYVITDIYGHVDCFSSGIGSLLNLSPQLFKDNQQINIQILAPELIQAFEHRKPVNQQNLNRQSSQSSEVNRWGRRSSNIYQQNYGFSKFLQNNKYSMPGGDVLTFYVPNNFSQLAKSEKPTKHNRASGKQKKYQGDDPSGPTASTQSKLIKSTQFREFMKYLSKGRSYAKRGPDLKKLLQCKEYRDYETKKSVNVEIREWSIPVGKSDEKGLKLLIFMIAKNQQDKKPQDLQSFNEGQNAASPNNNEHYDQNFDQTTNTPKYQYTQARNTQFNAQSSLRQQNSNSVITPNGFNNQLRNTMQVSDKVREASRMSFVDTQQNAQILAQQLQGTLTFTELGNKQQSEKLSPIREEENELYETPLKPKELFGELYQPSDQFIHSHLKSKDEEQDLVETPRIDIKRDIAINEGIKITSKSFSESHSNMGSGTKLSLQNKDSKLNVGQGPLKLLKTDLVENQEPKDQIIQEQLHDSNEFHMKEQSKPDQIGGSDPKELETSGHDSDGMDEDFEDEDFEDEDGEGDEEGQESDNSQGSKKDLLKQQTKGSQSNKNSYRYNQNQNYQNNEDGFNRQQYNNFDRQATQQQQQVKKAKVHDYARIVSNPKYKYLDEETCGSAYFNDCNCSERELDIRDMIKRNETNKKRRERRRKKRKEDEDKQGSEEEKTDKVEESKDEEEKEKGGRTKARRKRKKTDESESKSKSRSRKSESSEGANSQDEALMEQEEKDMEAERLQEQPNDEGEVSSVASSQQSQTRTYYSLRTAIDEKFVPLSIRNLNKVANLVYGVIVFLAITYYAIQYSLFTNSKEYIEILIHSEKRRDEIININLKLNDLAMINENILFPQNYELPKSQLIDQYVQTFRNSSTKLKDSQTALSVGTAFMDESARSVINPNNIVLEYEKINGLPNTYQFNTWEAIVEIVVAAYRLAENGTQIMHNNTVASFITNNCMNSITSALQGSTMAVTQEQQQKRENNMKVFLFLLIAVSCALLLSMAFLLPVIKNVKNNKQEVFELFTHRKIEKCIDDQLKKCRWFITKYQAQAESQGGGNYEGDVLDNAIEENTHIPEKEMSSNDDKSSDYYKNYKKQKKKWKQLNNNFGTLTLRFLLILLLIETYFLASYLLSQQFMSNISDLTKELKYLISRQPNLSFLLLMEKEMFYSNNTAQFKFLPVKQVIDSAYITQYQSQGSLLSIFSTNYKFHSDRYNTDFNNIIYADVCEYLTFENITKEECQTFNQGILRKGIYNAIVKYWTSLNQIHNDFYGSNRTQQDIKQILNHQKLLVSEKMTDVYFSKSHEHLVKILKQDIDTFFVSEFSQNQIIFIVYLTYILLIYFFVWRIFLARLMQELWKAKSVLSVMPIDFCFRIEEIRTFIYKNSSTFSVTN